VAVYLPAGGWYDFWTGARYEGPGGVTLDAPLDRLPLLVRAGAIVPMGPIIQHTGLPQAEITLLIYPLGASRFEMYETTAGPTRTGRPPCADPDRVRRRARGGHGAYRRADGRSVDGAGRPALP